MSDTKTKATGVSRREFGKFFAVGAASAALMPLGASMAFAADGTLNIAHPVFDMDWSPLRGGGNYYRWNSLWWASPMYFDADGNIQPYVFDSWSGSDDSSVWTFTIADRAVFSDGSDITAADVKGSWEVASMPATRSQRANLVLAGVGGFDAVTGGEANTLSGVEVVDDKTLRVTLDAPDPIFFKKLANHLAPIVKASSVRDETGAEIIEWWAPENGVVVSGPFMPTVMDLDGGLVAFEPNPNFFGPAPALSRIEIRSIEDAVTATALLQSGEMDAHTELGTPTMIQDLGAEFAAGPLIPKGQHFWLNVSREPTNDPKVREALIKAVDRDGLIRATFPDGPHQKADEILNAVVGANGDFEPYAFDPEAARAALAESSYGSPEALPRLMMVGISTPANAAAAQYIAEQWRQNLGITAVDMKPNIDAYTGPDQGNVQIFRDDVGTRVPDAVAYLMGAIHSSSSNARNKLGGYANAQIDTLLEEAGTMADDNPDRVAMAQQAQALFMSEHTFIPWYHEAMSRWAMPYVEGMEKNLDWQVVAPWAIVVNK